MALTLLPPFEDDDEYLPVLLDAPMRAWLAELVRATGAEPGTIIVSLLKAIREDDEAAHGLH